MKSGHQAGGVGTKQAATESEQAELAELRRRYIPRGITTAHPLVADHAQGRRALGRRRAAATSTSRAASA